MGLSWDGRFFVPYMQKNHLWDGDSLWDTNLKLGYFTASSAGEGEGKNWNQWIHRWTLRCSQGVAQSRSVWLAENQINILIALKWFTLMKKNLANFPALRGSKDSFRFSQLKFLHFLVSLITYVLIHCVAQGSTEWWEEGEKSFCSSWRHWRSRDRILFSYQRKSWRRSTEKIKKLSKPSIQVLIFQSKQPVFRCQIC